MICVRPLAVHLNPIGVEQDDRATVLSTGDDHEPVDGKLAATGDPIVGVERTTYDDATGSGALPAKPLVSPRAMTASRFDSSAI